MRLVVIALAGWWLVGAAHAGAPAWWTTRGVLNAQATPNDYAGVNQGQVKNLAVQAAAELDANLPGGAGPAVAALVSSFTLTNNYLPANLGQLKTVAKPFYDRLIGVGYTNAYPWSGSPNDYALANIGQLKNLFSWDLTTDSVGDGIPDWWRRAYFNGAGTTTNNFSCATCDYDGDGISNRDEYLAGTDPTNPDTTPPVITYSPHPNAAGWYTNALTIVFSATDNATNYTWLTPHEFTIPSETNDYEIVVSAKDTAGNVATEYVYVNIDMTPPVVTVKPGNGGTIDLSNPLVQITYNDPVTNGVSAGLNLATLHIRIDGNDVTTNFYIAAGGAVGDASAATVGWHTNIVSIADYADNQTCVTNIFYATGQANPNAPAMTNLDLPDGVTVLPDMPEVWVQGLVSDTGAVVSASVNGGESIPMNRRDGIFGYLLPLAPGTNVIVVTATNAGGSCVSSKLMVVERADRYQAALAWSDGSTGFGKFANGATQIVSGVISAWDGTNAVASVTLPGAATTFTVNGNGSASYTASVPPPCTVWSIMVIICWVDGTCQHVPLGLLEGYEIIAMHQWWEWIGGPIRYYPNGGGCTGWQVGTDRTVADYSFQAGAVSNNTTEAESWDLGPSTGGVCMASLSLNLPNSWESKGPAFLTNWASAQPTVGPATIWWMGYPEDLIRGLQLGEGSYLHEYQPEAELTDGHVDRRDGSLTFRIPFYYPAGQSVVFTLEGLGSNCDWQQVKLWGHDPIAPGAYVLTIGTDLQSTTTLNLDAFEWPETAAPAGCIEYVNHVLSFSGFHNCRPEIKSPCGSADGVGNTKECWRSGPARFDFQSVTTSTPNWQDHVLVIGGDACPEIGYQWTLDGAAGTLSYQTTAAPNHWPPSFVSGNCADGTLTLSGMAHKQVKIYRDHLARDMENFGADTYCGNQEWGFMRFGVPVTMYNMWNCHGSVLHAYNGGGSGWEDDVPTTGWKSEKHPYPFNSPSAQAAICGMNEGDVVAYFDNRYSRAQHSATSMGGSMTHGANNSLMKYKADGPNGPGYYASWKWGKQSVFTCADDFYYHGSLSWWNFHMDYILIFKKP